MLLFLVILGAGMALRIILRRREIRRLQLETLAQLEKDLQHEHWLNHAANCNECETYTRTRCHEGYLYLLRDSLRSKHTPEKVQEPFGV